jgi:hypothetical protein
LHSFFRFITAVVSLWLVEQETFDADFFQLLDQFAILMHLQHNVTSADKFAIDEYLWNRWPVGEIFDT